LLSDFSATVTDVVHADGGRVVKFIGDAVMWVNSSPRLLVQAAVDLANHPRFREYGMQVRAGLAFGPVLDLNGDYFGHPVNLAARLVSAAAPGEILASTAVREAVPEWSAIACEPLNLRGIDEPVTAYLMRI
jgi:class 3 adenylate cyclase